MTRCIVCGLDETSGSRHAASIAARLARDLDSRALLVRVTDRGGFLRRAIPISGGRTRQMRRGLKAVADEHCFPDGTETRVKTGAAADTLIDVAERENAELIVVGAGGQSSVSTILVGSESSTLMREAPCPVVAVPSDTIAPLDAEGMRSVVCGVAGEGTDAEVLRLGKDLANRLGGELHAVHAFDPETMPAAPPGGDPRDAADRRLAAALENAGVEAQRSVLPKPAADALERVAGQRKASLIVVRASGDSEPGSFVLGSVTTRLVAQGGIAVVVLPPGTRLEVGSGHYELVAASA